MKRSCELGRDIFTPYCVDYPEPQMEFDVLDESYKPYHLKRADATKKNTGHFFTALFNTQFPGRVHSFGGGREDYFTEKGQLNFQPDHVQKKGRRTIRTEIKSNHLKVSTPFLDKTQLELYIESSLSDREKGKQSYAQYAFYRYGNSHRERGLKELNYEGLICNLTNCVSELTIVPENLLLSYYSFFKLISLNQSTSNAGLDSKLYRIPLRSHMTAIRGDAVKNHPVRTDKNYQFDKSFFDKMFCLNGIVRTSYQFGDKSICRIKSSYNGREIDFPIRPFEVIEYEIGDIGAWFDSFEKNRREIFRTSRIKDIHSENNKIDRPF